MNNKDQAPHAPTLGDLFTPEPEQWGLRGDPQVWAALCDHLSAVPLPEGERESRQRLVTAFEVAVGVSLDDADAPEAFFRGEFAHGGMSSGHVCLSTWRDRLIPLLLERANTARS